MKRFMFLSIGVLCLAIAALIGFYIGSESARAQAPGVVVGYGWSGMVATTEDVPVTAMLDNGDVYANVTNSVKTYQVGEGSRTFRAFKDPAIYLGNFWTGGWGKLKEPGGKK